MFRRGRVVVSQDRLSDWDREDRADRLVVIGKLKA